MEGRVSPHSKTGPLLALGTFSIPCPLPGGPAKASHIQAKALCALSRNHPHLRWAQQRAPQLPNRKEDPIQFPLPLPLRPSPLLCDCQEMKGCSSPPPLFCSRGVGLGRPDFCSCPQPALTLLCLDLHLSQDFLRTKNKQTKNLKKKKKKVTKKSYKKRIKNFQRITIYFINLRIYYINIYSPSNISLPPLALIMKT